MRKHYRMLCLIAAVVAIPLLYWVPSYGALMLMSIVGVLLFSLGVSVFMVLLASVERGAISLSRLLRRGWHAAHSSLIHH
jgi:hypothetical protein